VVFLGHATARPVGALRAGVWIGHPVGEDWSSSLWKDFIVFARTRWRGSCASGGGATGGQSRGRHLSQRRKLAQRRWRVARDIETMSPFEEFNGAEAFFHPGPRQHMLLAWRRGEAPRGGRQARHRLQPPLPGGLALPAASAGRGEARGRSDCGLWRQPLDRCLRLLDGQRP